MGFPSKRLSFIAYSKTNLCPQHRNNRARTSPGQLDRLKHRVNRLHRGDFLERDGGPAPRGPAGCRSAREDVGDGAEVLLHGGGTILSFESELKEISYWRAPERRANTTC
jgi:hypothetical protein